MTGRRETEIGTAGISADPYLKWGTGAWLLGFEASNTRNKGKTWPGRLDRKSVSPTRTKSSLYTDQLLRISPSFCSSPHGHLSACLSEPVSFLSKEADRHSDNGGSKGQIGTGKGPRFGLGYSVNKWLGHWILTYGARHYSRSGGCKHTVHQSSLQWYWQVTWYQF